MEFVRRKAVVGGGALLALHLVLAPLGPIPPAGAGQEQVREQAMRRHSPTQPLRPRQPRTRSRSRGSDADQGNGPDGRRIPLRFPSEWRAIDGSGNNPIFPAWGRANQELLRLTGSEYGDAVESPAGGFRPSPRDISNAVVAQVRSRPNTARASDFLWVWGQFLDHDIDLTPIIEPVEAFDILVPRGDPFFDPQGTGTRVIPFNRSFYHLVDGVREQVNEITAYIDASNVYGSDTVRARAMRTLDGTGRMKTSAGDLLPLNEAGLPNAPSSDPSFFLAGDFRANEQVGLTALHVLFVREHNGWADRVRTRHPALSGDEIYEIARAMVAAEIQAITYNEFLPLLLGPDALRPYRGYHSEVNPGITNEFATAAYRVGHTMVSPMLLRLGEDGEPIPDGPLPLDEAFFDPGLMDDQGIDPFLRGFAAQVAQEIDTEIVDGLRNFLFGPPGAGGFDLASLNIQRGRDHGLPRYNAVRVDLGLEPALTFADVTPDPAVQQRLTLVYGTVDDLDLWVGGLAEDHVPGALVGETFFVILKDQFERLRDGDRFWYQSYLSPSLVRRVEQATLARIIRRNTGIGPEIQHDVFVVPTPKGPPANLPARPRAR